jgi:hypothetical protein
MEYHPGINIAHIPVKGIPGLLFLIATLFTFLVGIPMLRDFLLVTGAAGIIGAGIIYYWHNQTRW